ncbi:unnamed protein product [Schistosoma mattheei]|uniref:Uncharacterized protein n=1 Tax=Schistosoma mattheei TaxID=31246 RepID=A0A183NDA7_9TREM|nr:unnamed protein product [Schistosoma mattheei]
MTKEDEDVNIVDFLTFIGKEAYNILKTVALPENSILLPYTALKELMLDYVKYTNFECGKGRFRKMIHEDMKAPVHYETISEESNIICPRNAFVACGKLVHARVLNYLDFDYNSDDFISTAVYPYHEVTSNVYSNQREKYMLNEATSFIASGYEDSTLFRGEVYSKSLWF